MTVTEAGNYHRTLAPLNIAAAEDKRQRAEAMARANAKLNLPPPSRLERIAAVIFRSHAR